MNTRIASLTLIVLILLLTFTYPVASKPTVSIIVNNADAVRQDSFTVDQSLSDLFAGVGPRIIVQFAKHMREIKFVDIPSALEPLFNQVSERIIIQFAKTNHKAILTYPIDFFNDSTPPIISNVSAQGMGIITWKTDEFATSTVIYGANTVVGLGEIIDPLYTKQHQVTLSGLTPGETYKYKVRSTDRSGNTRTSKEFNFTAEVSLSVYMPLVNR